MSNTEVTHIPEGENTTLVKAYCSTGNRLKAKLKFAQSFKSFVAHQLAFEAREFSTFCFGKEKDRRNQCHGGPTE